MRYITVRNIGILMGIIWIASEYTCLAGSMGYGGGFEHRIAAAFFVCMAAGAFALGMKAQRKKIFLQGLGILCGAAIVLLLITTYIARSNADLESGGLIFFLMIVLLFGSPLINLTEHLLDLFGVVGLGHWELMLTGVYYILFFLCGYAGMKWSSKKSTLMEVQDEKVH